MYDVKLIFYKYIFNHHINKLKFSKVVLFINMMIKIKQNIFCLILIYKYLYIKCLI